jgi:hypothetical protein
VIERLVALDQAKGAHRIGAKGVGAWFGRVFQRAPDALAIGHPDRQAIGIVHFRPPVAVVDAGRLIKAEHAGHRRQAQPRHILAQEQRGLDLLHHARLGLARIDGIGAGQRWTFEQGVDDQALAPFRPPRSSIQNSVNSGNSSAPGIVPVSTATPRAERPNWSFSPPRGNRMRPGRPANRRARLRA